MSQTGLILSSDLLGQATEHGVAVTSVERRVLSMEGKLTISDTSDTMLVKQCKAIVQSAIKDLGITSQVEEYDAARFFDVLKEYFGDMVIEEVKMAFELYVMHQLDDYLPRDSKGSPVSHYNKFSMRFYVDVLKAYRQRRQHAKNNVQGKVSMLLLEKASAEQDPFEVRCGFLGVLKSLIVRLANGERPSMALTLSAEAALRKLKLLPQVVTPTDADYSAARLSMTKNKDIVIGMSLDNALKAGFRTDSWQNTAQVIATRRVLRETVEQLGAEEVARRFDWFIETTRQKIGKREAQVQ